MNQKRSLQVEIKLSDLFLIMKKNIKQLFLWTLTGCLISCLFAFVLITPKYSSTVDILVNQKADNSQTQFNVQQADLQAINTYKDVLKRSVILQPTLERAQKKNNYQGSLKTLSKNVEIENANNSQIISIKVIDKNAYTAKDIANDISHIFTKKIKKMMKVDNVMIVTKATVQTKPVSPNKKIYLFIGIIFGFMFGICMALLKEVMDTSVKSVDFLEDLGLINLGKIYHIKNSNEGHQVIRAISNLDSKEKRRRV